jgi:hypothetical protein
MSQQGWTGMQRTSSRLFHAIDPLTVYDLASYGRGGRDRWLPRAFGDVRRIPDHLRSVRSPAGGHVRPNASRASVACVVGFGIASVAVSCSLAGLSIYAFNMWGMIGMALGSLCGVPLILGFGTAWSAAATRREAVRRRSPLLAWPLVIVLAALPLTMLFTDWPLRLAFLASKPALDRLADRVAAGHAPGRPVLAGLFMVVNSEVDPTTGNVGLVTDPDPSGRSGFVRVSPAPSTSPGRVRGPFYNLNGDLYMGGRWRYQNED